MKSKKIYSVILLIFAIVVMTFSINKITDARRSSASIIKKYTEAKGNNGLTPITYNGEEMYVAKATFYDYYSDTQVGTSATAGEITDALDNSKNTFSKFNNKIMQALHYNDSALCPAKYPLYQGRPGATSDMRNIYNPSSEQITAKANYWVGAQSGQNTVAATQGLVDSSLSYDSNGVSYVTQSNPANGKSSYLPYFDKKFLTTTKFDNSELTLGSVKENVSFPFRRVEKNGITYYEFYSSQDTVRFNNYGQFEYFGKDNKEQQVLDAEGKPGFFPYNTKAEGKSSKLNFGHGVKIEIPFMMSSNGKIKDKDIEFEFSGDDDVWVFIDGELALDLGGNHGEVSGTINFAKQVSTVKQAKNNSVAFANRLVTNAKNGIIHNQKIEFSDKLKTKIKSTEKMHTLTMFYMERGLNVANMKLSFNLPEPTRITLTNELKTDNISDTFKDEAIKVAKKDEFIYDVADKTKLRASEVSLLADENVAFINEFDAKNILLIQERALKDTNRKLTDLYSTSWILKDVSEEINKGNSLIMTDNRSSDKSSFLFANKSGDDVPVLTASYTNAPNIGNFNVICDVTDDYKKAHEDYASKEFTYTVTYKNVFGGGSAETNYSGKYTIYTTNDNKEEKITTDGTIILKPGEKAEITDIPVLTVLKATAKIDDTYQLNAITTTPNFKIDNATLSASGAITINNNIVQFTVSDIKEEIKDIENETLPQNNAPSKDDKKETEKVEKIEIAEDAFDSTPKTADSSDFGTWLAIMGISLAIAIGASLSLVITRKR